MEKEIIPTKPHISISSEKIYSTMQTAVCSDFQKLNLNGELVPLQHSVECVFQQNNCYNHTTTNNNTFNIFKWNTTDLSDWNKINCVMCIWMRMWMCEPMAANERMSNWVKDREMDRNKSSQRDIVYVNGGGQCVHGYNIYSNFSVGAS